jgi:hypothetical protein
MSNLNFLNTDNCNDVGVDTPTQDLTFVDYIFKNKVKDFTNVRKYTVTYSTNCKDEVTVDVPPNYNLNVEIESCTLIGGAGGDGEYVFKLTGINPDFVSTIESCDPTYTICFSDAGIIKTSTYTLFGSLGNIAASPTTLYFKVNTIDGFEYRISFVLTQAGVTNCDYTLGSFSSIYDLPLNIGQPTYGGKFATTGVLGLQIGPDIVVEIVADNVGTVGNISIVTDGISTLDFWVNDWNTNNPTNTVTLTYIAGSNWIGTGGTFTLSGGVNPTIPDNLQLSLNTLYNLPVLYPALYGVKICEVDVNDNEICLENNQFIDCQTAECIDSDLCDSTEDICNLTSQVKKQYQSIIYGIDCCGEAKQKILKHYIRIVCPSELNC